MLSNAYFLAKFRFDTAENGPAKNLKNLVNFPNFGGLAGPHQAMRELVRVGAEVPGHRLGARGALPRHPRLPDLHRLRARAGRS